MKERWKKKKKKMGGVRVGGRERMIIDALYSERIGFIYILH